MSHTILLVEDNPHIMEINHEALMMEGYDVLEAEDAQGCIATLESNDVDLIVLDIMLPDIDGLSLCKQIKAMYDIPILFLSALGESEQIIEGLRVGGDDYLSKPYDIGVLLARIEVRLRASWSRKRFITYGSMQLDTVALIAYEGGKDLLLNQKEYSLLLALIRNPKQLMEKKDLYRSVWGTQAGDNLGTLHTTISRLNKKLDKAGTGKRVVYQRGEGYRIEEV